MEYENLGKMRIVFLYFALFAAYSVYNMINKNK